MTEEHTIPNMAKNMSYQVMQRTHHIKCGKENKVSNAKKKELFV
jgi:hypothetical protein